MNKITSKPFLDKKWLLPAIIILCSFFTSENAVSLDYWNWNRKSIYLDYFKDTNILELWFIYIGYNIGPYQERGYVERCEYQYSTDGKNYTTFAKCETKDQLLDELLWVKMTNKLPDAKIYLHGCKIPRNGTLWEDSTNPWVAVPQFDDGKSYCAFLTLLWYLSLDVKVKEIRVKGKWCVSGLYCPDYFDEIYDLSKTSFNSTLKSDVNTDSKQKDEKGQGNAKVSSKADAIVIQGADCGEKINIYTTAGVPVKSIVVNEDLINIQLPAKQVYIVNVGHTRYKVAL